MHRPAAFLDLPQLDLDDGTASILQQLLGARGAIDKQAGEIVGNREGLIEHARRLAALESALAAEKRVGVTVSARSTGLEQAMDKANEALEHLRARVAELEGGAGLEYPETCAMLVWSAIAPFAEQVEHRCIGEPGHKGDHVFMVPQ